jgi:hypothetical protein
MMQLHTGAELFGNVVNCGITERGCSISAAIEAVVKRALSVSEMSPTCGIYTVQLHC